MYVRPDHWSETEDTDPPPCFRQGDVVRIAWVRPEVDAKQDTRSLFIRSLEVRTEPVVLLSACCDLVDRKPSKRKGVLISPIREVPKQIAKKPGLLAALRANVEAAVEGQFAIPANLFYLAPAITIPEGVIHLEAMAMIEFSVLRAGEKLAELTSVARFDLQERIKWHFTRTEP